MRVAKIGMPGPMVGKKHTEETKQKLRSRFNHINPIELRRRHEDGEAVKVLAKEFNASIGVICRRIIMAGGVLRNRDEANKLSAKKIKASGIRRIYSEDQRKRKGLSFLGRKHTEESKNKFRETIKRKFENGYKISQETKEKLREAHKRRKKSGWKMSDETRIKIGLASVARHKREKEMRNTSCERGGELGEQMVLEGLGLS